MTLGVLVSKSTFVMHHMLRMIATGFLSFDDLKIGFVSFKTCRSTYKLKFKVAVA